MKSKVLLFGILFMFLIFFLQGISSELNETHIIKGYRCLQNKTANCSSSIDDNIFTLLALKSCKSKVLDASSNNECWPSGNCNIKQTAQALFALKESGSDTSKPKAWLLSRNKTVANINWFLQIESSEATECSIKYGNPPHSYQVSIGDDKKITGSAGSCLSLAQDNYWLKISSLSSCQNYDYEISCSKNFQTSTLFKKENSDTIYVTGKEINSPSAGGTATERVISSCFADANTCSYEGTLWASLVLNSMDEDISSYLPYLVVMAGDYSRTIPEAFLYILLGNDYKTDLLLKQKSSKYWDSSGNKYYDTALALLALKSDEETEKTNTLNWLKDTQGNDGCWQGSIKDTAFLLYAISPRPASGDNGGGSSKPDCEIVGDGYCMSSLSCSLAGGSVLDEYQCSSGLLICCDKEKTVLTCVSGQGGEICSSNEQCFGGIEVEASDISSSEKCCVEGECIAGNGGTGKTDCEINNGTCRSDCLSDEQNASFSCDSYSQICCVKKTTSEANYLWIWILAGLIILLIVFIIFRDKLRRFWLYSKSKFKPSGPSGSAPYHSPMQYFGTTTNRIIPRRILPSSATHQHKPTPARRSTGEFDEVLKKLKDMSK